MSQVGHHIDEGLIQCNWGAGAITVNQKWDDQGKFWEKSCELNYEISVPTQIIKNLLQS